MAIAGACDRTWMAFAGADRQRRVSSTPRRTLRGLCAPRNSSLASPEPCAEVGDHAGLERHHANGLRARLPRRGRVVDEGDRELGHAGRRDDIHDAGDPSRRYVQSQYVDTLEFTLDSAKQVKGGAAPSPEDADGLQSPEELEV